MEKNNSDEIKRLKELYNLKLSVKVQRDIIKEQKKEITKLKKQATRYKNDRAFFKEIVEENNL